MNLQNLPYPRYYCGWRVPLRHGKEGPMPLSCSPWQGCASMPHSSQFSGPGFTALPYARWARRDCGILFHDAVRNPHLRQVALPVDYVLFHGRSFRIHHDEPAEAGDTRASLDAGIAKCLVHPARNGLHVLLFRVGMCFHPCGSRNHTTYGTLSPHS